LNKTCVFIFFRDRLLLTAAMKRGEAVLVAAVHLGATWFQNNNKKSVIYKLSFKARAFVRIGWTSLSWSNTLAYNKNSQITGKKLLSLALGVNVMKVFTIVIYELLK
jgi:hypothetical protein